jgi:AraC-like DNA-binding protein
MARLPAPVVAPAVNTKEGDPGISPELVKNILRNLEKFESGKKYLEKGMDLYRMAVLLHTNTKYVTRVIQHYRGKGTIEYITDLRIDHIVSLLKSENRYRNYTDKALADEAGFGSTQNFSRAFRARTKMPPRYFIGELRKQPNKPFDIG